jgi:glycopeptide antibiotics resistance protein
VYRHTLPYRVIAGIFGEDDEDVAATVLRKVYSIVAFTIVGLTVNVALTPSRRRTLWTIVAVAAFSACIEVAQKVHHAREGLASNLFDVACGALGGYLGAMIVEAVRRANKTPTQPPALRG